MRTNEERVRLIRERTREIKRERRARRKRAADIMLIAASVLLIIGIGVWLPKFTENTVARTSETSGAASLVASGGALGYILIGIMGFLLGICVTVLIAKLGRRDRRRRQEDDDEDG